MLYCAAAEAWEESTRPGMTCPDPGFGFDFGVGVGVGHEFANVFRNGYEPEPEVESDFDFDFDFADMSD